MSENQAGRHRGGWPVAAVLAACLAVVVAVGLAVSQFSALGYFDPLGLSTASRTLNGAMAIVMTSIALILPLTSNLYTPRLVKLYVAHPLIIGGLSVFILGNLLVMVLHFFPPAHPFARWGTRLIVMLYGLVLLGILPYLFGVSRFLRPSFFMPMLTRKGLRSLRELGRGKRLEVHKDNLFEIIDVVTNVALTGMIRGDRQLVILSLKSLHELFKGIIAHSGEAGQTWRKSRPWFLPGLAQEGQAYLVRESVWPEAYVLAQMLKVTEVANKRQHELLSELAGQLVETARLACASGSESVIELHVMAFNTLFREAVEEKDLRRFQNLSYHYRLLIEAFHTMPLRMDEATRHLLHYARMGAREGLPFALETVTYDLGELVLSLGRAAEHRAVELIQSWAGPLWQECIAQGGGLRKVGWRALLRTHWEAKVAGLKEVADAIYWRFLNDAAIHREQLELLLEENRELHFEFNDRLMRFAHLSPQAEAEAQAFLAEW